MTIFTDGLNVASKEKGIDEFQSGFWESRGASVGQGLADASSTSFYNFLTNPVDSENSFPSQTDVLGNVVDTGPAVAEATRPAAPRIDMIDATDRVKKAGLGPFLKLPDEPDILPAQLEIMMNRAKDRREREATVERGPQGFIPSALDVATSFLVGAVDPINVASAFIPVMGELRYGKLLAEAGESAASRFGVRATVGAAQGAVGQAALEPLDWWQHTQDGRDFGMADVLHNMMFGAVLGGALHSGGGAVSDAYRSLRGRPLYPFGPGEPLENVQGTHLPAALLHEDGVSSDALAQHFAEPPEPTAADFAPQRVPLRDPSVDMEGLGQPIEASPAADRTPSPEVQTINDLPQRAHEDAMRGAIASLIDGEPVRAGEMLEAAAQTDPRIAESFEAFHGSPHDFDRFDIDRIGSGEGAQAFGHGLYFAQNEKVARGYQRRTSDKVFVDKVAQLYDEHFSPDEAWSEIQSHWGEFSNPEQHLMEALRKDDWLGFDYPHQAVSVALSPRAAERWEMSPETIAAARAMGNMYRVKINADQEHFLDWDKPLDEQSASVKAAIENIYRKFYTSEDWRKQLAEDAKLAAPEFYNRLIQLSTNFGNDLGNGVGGGGNRQAAHALAEAGIPGIKYLDQGSRRASGEGTRNFVVFDDKHIDITHKNGEPVSREQFLAERAKESEDVKTTHVAPKAARGRAAADPKTWSLFEFLAHEGGLKPDPELEAILGNKRGPFVPGFGALIRQKGRTLDDALRLAKDHGYMFDAADVTGAEARLTPRDLLDLLTEENAGRTQYRMDQNIERKVDADREAHEIVSHLRDEIEAVTGMKDVHLDPAIERRVVEIFTREGETDVLNAYERAIMEREERNDVAAEARRADQQDRVYPGWDVHDDARSAPEGGGAPAVDRGPAGSAGPGRGGNAGDLSRAAGADDRAAPEAALDRDAAWHALAERTPEYDDPEVIAASNEADRVRPPPTKLDERVAASEKADAFAKKMYDMFANRLEPEDRQRLDDLIKRIDDDHEARQIATIRGGSCLFGVV